MHSYHKIEGLPIFFGENIHIGSTKDCTLGRVSSTSGQKFQFAVEILVEVSKTSREYFYPGQNQALVTQRLV